MIKFEMTLNCKDVKMIIHNDYVCVYNANIYIKADEKLDNKMSNILNKIQNTDDEISKVCMDYLKAFFEKYNKVKKSALDFDRNLWSKFEKVGLPGLTTSEKRYLYTLILKDHEEVSKSKKCEALIEESYQKLIKTIPNYENHN